MLGLELGLELALRSRLGFGFGSEYLNSRYSEANDQVRASVRIANVTRGKPCDRAKAGTEVLKPQPAPNLTLARPTNPSPNPNPKL